MLNEIVSWVPILGPLIAAIIAVFGWYKAHQLNMTRDRNNKRRDMLTKYLLEAYRQLEMTAHRDDATEEQRLAFESAIADIQLLGNSSHIQEIAHFMDEYTSAKGAPIDRMLCLLRDDLRKELELSPIEKPPKIFRFKRN